jgi:hypothetical protein
MELETNDISGWLKIFPAELKFRAGTTYRGKLLEVESIARNCRGKENGYAVFSFLCREGNAEGHLKYFAALPSEDLPREKCIKIMAIINALGFKGWTGNLPDLVQRECWVIPSEDRGGRLVVKTVLPIPTPSGESSLDKTQNQRTDLPAEGVAQ